MSKSTLTAASLSVAFLLLSALNAFVIAVGISKYKALHVKQGKVQCDSGFASEWSKVTEINNGNITFKLATDGEIFYRKMNNNEICTIVYKKDDGSKVN